MLPLRWLNSMTPHRRLAVLLPLRLTGLRPASQYRPHRQMGCRPARRLAHPVRPVATPRIGLPTGSRTGRLPVRPPGPRVQEGRRWTMPPSWSLPVVGPRRSADWQLPTPPPRWPRWIRPQQEQTTQCFPLESLAALLAALPTGSQIEKSWGLQVRQDFAPRPHPKSRSRASSRARSRPGVSAPILLRSGHGLLRRWSARPTQVYRRCHCFRSTSHQRVSPDLN